MRRGLFGIRADRDRKENCDHLRQLVRLMQVDGVTDAERRLLEQVAQRWGISTLRLKWIESDLGRVPEAIPEDGIKKARQLYDLVSMMICDGKISELEMTLVHARAHLLGFEQGNVTYLIEAGKRLIANHGETPAPTPKQTKKAKGKQRSAGKGA